MVYNIAMLSLGCPKNLTDAETMLALLEKENYNIVSDAGDADVIIVNTCGFIEAAKQESIDALLEMAEYKNDRCKLLIATGCLAERYNEQIIEQIPEVDAVIGTGDFHKIAEVINTCFQNSTYKPCLYGHIDFTPDVTDRKISTPRYVAYIKISDGCDNRCTYCAIPYIRGKYRSRPMEDIVAEAKKLAESGVKELILIAQDTTRYGKDIYGKYSLARLLKELCRIEPLKWIRLHYLYTEAITDELIDTIASEDKICKYIDMPIQHADDNILKRMARRSDSRQIEEVVNKLRAKIPGVCIRTTVIVGFPGETDKEFDTLYKFMRKMKFDRAGVFAYSQEEGTPAAKFDNQVDDEIKQQRYDSLMRLCMGISHEKNKSKLGSELTVLTEGYDEESYLYYGRSEADSIDIDSKVYFAAMHDVEAGEFVNVEILDCDEFDLTGKVKY